MSGTAKQVTREQVLNINQYVRDKSLVVIDEAQNFWPNGRGKLPDPITQFVTEHRHRGLDVVLMGQNLNDVHSLWRNRIDRKFVFMKLDALGQDKRYSWASYKGALRGGGQRSRIDFEKLTSGIKVYEPQYFGSYASTTSDDNEMGVYQDDRTNILKTAKFKFGVPLALIVVIGSLWYCLDLLFNFGEHTGTEEATKQQQVATSPASPGQSAPSPTPPPKPKVEDLFTQSIDGYQPVLTSQTVVNSQLLDAWIEVWDDKDNSVMMWRSSDLTQLGWTVALKTYGLVISKGKVTMLIRERNTLAPTKNGSLTSGVTDSVKESL
ncbi:zonular occludens toxin domain-containing protein [Aeromonas hydrophila]|uniref:zonular occludens toxin domain-containing protein n=1 Tax=Aeromonas hydrophila TaxID=644 RepID=UPI00256EF4DC|nr:zonular occludens toxin domain-containing protein [Aeromonas hydrophila]MDL5385702.1 zonular occludens toxin domain-containing protein [Aeromonas hydrophila]